MTSGLSGMRADLPRGAAPSIAAIPARPARPRMGATAPGRPNVTTRIALILAALIVAFFLLDHFVLHLGALLFLAQKFADLTEWVAFWR